MFVVGVRWIAPTVVFQKRVSMKRWTTVLVSKVGRMIEQRRKHVLQSPWRPDVDREKYMWEMDRLNWARGKMDLVGKRMMESFS